MCLATYDYNRANNVKETRKAVKRLLREHDIKLDNYEMEETN